MDFLLYVEAVIAVLLTVCVLLQQRAAGLTAGGSGMNTMVVQRRGAELVLFRATTVLAVLFALLVVLDWFI